MRPAAVEPVKAILSTPGWRTRCSPTSRPAGITLTTPFGMPASSSSSAMSMASSGVSGEGLMTIVDPDSRAGASLDIVTNCGTFHGTMAPTTPTPSLRTMTGVPSMPVRSSSQSYLAASAMKLLSIIQGAGRLGQLGEADRRAHLGGDDLGHVHHPGGVDVREPLHGGDAVGRAHAGPLALVEGRAGRGDGPVDVGGGAVGHPTDDLLGVR